MPEELITSERYLESIIVICTHGWATLNRNTIEPASARCPGLLWVYTLPHAVWHFCFRQNFKWLKPCLTYTNVFPSVILQAVINRTEALPFWFRMKLCMGASIHRIWLESLDTVWMVSGWGFLKVIPVYTAPVEWLLHSVLRAMDALSLEDGTKTPCK